MLVNRRASRNRLVQQSESRETQRLSSGPGVRGMTTTYLGQNSRFADHVFKEVASLSGPCNSNGGVDPNASKHIGLNNFKGGNGPPLLENFSHTRIQKAQYQPTDQWDPNEDVAPDFMEANELVVAESQPREPAITGKRKEEADRCKKYQKLSKVLSAGTKDVENAIRCGGLAPTKASCIKNVLSCLLERRGKLCLEYLRDLSLDEIKSELSLFKGIGPKTLVSTSQVSYIIWPCSIPFYASKFLSGFAGGTKSNQQYIQHNHQF
ncbi:hypothetical protein K1719_026409 [Acacia pycnantha]|nr:hypothetical protein K1719_026409 [Acacia pycnantha]